MSARVGIDYLPAVCHAPGVGRYAREFVRALVHLPEMAEESAPQLHLFEVGGGARTMEGAPLGLDGVRVRRLSSRLPRRALRMLHSCTGRGADSLLGGVDLFHRALPDYPPVRAARQLLPVSTLPTRGSVADEMFGAIVRRMEGALVFCAHYAQELEARYDLDPARIHRAPVGCDHWLRDLAGASPASDPVPSLLVLGALRAERHPAAILAAFEELRAGGCEARLRFIGGAGSAEASLRAALARSPVRTDVSIEMGRAEAEMPRLVAGATLLVHLADDEGTAVTPLEACALGPAVVTSRLPAFEEALEEEAVYVDTMEAAHDPRVLAGALERGLARFGDPLRTEARRVVAARHTWSRNARKTLEVWRHLLLATPRN